MHTSRAHREVPGVEPFAGIIGSNVVGFVKDRPFLGWIGRNLKPFWKDRHQLKKIFKSYFIYTAPPGYVSYSQLALEHSEKGEKVISGAN